AGSFFAEDVVPDRVPRGAVEELGAGRLRGRCQSREPLPLLLAEHLPCPVRRAGRIAAELRDVERAEDGQVVVPAQAQRRPLADEVDTFVRARPVADEVAEAPELVDRFGVDLAEDGL